MGKLESAAGIIGLLVLFPALAASDPEYYTWIDENGVVNYSERNPQGYAAEYVSSQQRFGYRYERSDSGNEPSTKTPSTITEDPADQTSSDADIDIDAQIATEKARINDEIAAAKKSNCLIGKRNLAQLEAYARIRVRDDDGTERVIGDEEKTAKIEKARQTIRENCTG